MKTLNGLMRQRQMTLKDASVYKTSSATYVGGFISFSLW